MFKDKFTIYCIVFKINSKSNKSLHKPDVVEFKSIILVDIM